MKQSTSLDGEAPDGFRPRMRRQRIGTSIPIQSLQTFAATEIRSTRWIGLEDAFSFDVFGREPIGRDSHFFSERHPGKRILVFVGSAARYLCCIAASKASVNGVRFDTAHLPLPFLGRRSPFPQCEASTIPREAWIVNRPLQFWLNRKNCTLYATVGPKGPQPRRFACLQSENCPKVAAFLSASVENPFVNLIISR